MTTEIVADGTIPLRSGFDHALDPHLLASHRETWDQMRSETPVFRSDIAGDYDLWFMLRYEDNLAVLQDWELFSSSTVRYLPDRAQPMLPEELDPPEHTKYRKPLSKHFSPGEIRQWETHVREHCINLIEQIQVQNECEFVSDFAQKFPTMIFLKMMGLPVERCEQFIERAHRLMHTTKVADPDGAIRQSALTEILDDIREVFDARKLQPEDDLISRLVADRVDEDPIPEDDLVGMGFLLYLAGLDTVANLLTYSFKHLAEDESLRKYLTANPDRIPDAVEEFLRLYSIVSGARVVTRDVEFAGCPMKKNDRVVWVTAAAGRDPEQFERPTEFDLDRKPNRHLAFGAGPHRCVGSHLARLELCVAIEEWLARMPDYNIAPGAAFVEHVGTVAGIESLPLEWLNK